MESARETALRLEWMAKHLGVSFVEMRQRSQNALADTERNRREMQPSKGPPSFKYVDDLTARIQARRDAKK